jgi:uncharacterized protein
MAMIRALREERREFVSDRKSPAKQRTGPAGWFRRMGLPRHKLPPHHKLARLTRFRLIIPLKRHPGLPEIKARGVAWGTAIAMTPLVGIQMPLITLLWIAFRPFEALRFSLVLALAWTWVTNVFTLVPFYYAFYVTGQVLLGHWDNLAGYETFATLFSGALITEAGFLERTIRYIEWLAREIGVTMLIGCVPYVIGGAWISYALSIAFLRRRQRRRGGRGETAGAE